MVLYRLHLPRRLRHLPRRLHLHPLRLNSARRGLNLILKHFNVSRYRHLRHLRHRLR